MKKFVILFIVSISSIIQIFACTCIGNETLNEAIKSTDIVLKGKILDIHIHEKFNKESYDSYLEIIQILDSNERIDSSTFITKELYYEISIEKIYKGTYSDTTIFIHSGIINHADCKYIFKKGETYLIFTSNQRICIRKPKLSRNGQHVRRKGKYRTDKKKFITNTCYKNEIYNTKFEYQILKITKVD